MSEADVDLKLTADRSGFEGAVARGVIPRDVLRLLQGEQRRRAQTPEARAAIHAAAQAKRERRRARNLQRG